MTVAGGSTDPGANLGRPAFHVDGRTLRWADVVAWMRDTGGWDALAQRTRRGWALLVADRASPAGEELRVEARRFRYQRGLLTGEELDSWLSWWGLTSQEWAEWVDRSLRLAGAPDGEAGPASSEIPGEERAVWAEAVCGGELEDAAAELARATAAWAELRVEGPPSGAAGAAALRAAAAELTDRTPSPADLGMTVTRRAVPWTSVAVEWADFDRPDVAREAWACCRFDGQPLDAVAALAGVGARRAATLLEDLAAYLRPVASSAPVDEPVLAGPPEAPCAVVRDRRPASLDAPLVRARAVAACQEDHVAAVVRRWVRWDDGPGRH